MCSRLRAVSTGCSERSAPPEFTLAAPCAVTGTGGLHPACCMLRLPWHCREGEHCSQGAQGTKLYFGCQGARTVGAVPAREGKQSQARHQGGQGKGMLPWVQPCSGCKAAKPKARMAWSSLGELRKSPLGASQELKKSKTAEALRNPPGVACWPLQDKDGAIACRVHQLLLSLEASGKTHGKQRKSSCRPPQGLETGPGPARKSGEMPAGPGTLRDSSFRKAKLGHHGRASPEDPCKAVTAQLLGALLQHQHSAGLAHDGDPA